MRVFVTGASGFVGSHTVAALLAAGHRPRALVRDPGRTAKVLGAIGVAAEDVELVPGDMLDADAVSEALEGCDAAIHAAAAIGVTGARGRGGAAGGPLDLVDVNVRGTRNVVGGAVAQGLSPVVHVSTVAVFVPPSAQVITAGGALASPRTGYGGSKLAAERYVRGLQDDGAPVTIVYPGGVCGPHQPTLDALMEGLAAALGKVWPLPGGGVSVIDVRDLGEALARSVAAGQPPSRWVLGGHYLTWPQYADLCDRLTGVRCRRVRVPSRLMLGLGSALDAAKRVRDFDYPLTRDAAEFMVTLVPTDDRPILDALDLTPRPVEETVADALRWLAESGHLGPRRAGRLANPPPPPRPAAPTSRPTSTSRIEEQPVPTIVQRVFGPVFQRISGAEWFSRVGPKVVPPIDRTLHRLTGGRFLLGQLLVPSLVLTTTGAVSGLPRRTPLACLPEQMPDGGWYVVGSNFGREKHPAWTGNLLKHPEAEVSFQGRTIPVTAHLLDDEERTAIWPRLIAVWPVYDRYVERTTRQLRIFRLTPR
ncbi:nitroreductase family deazaflavin-dependent oxidoreductase [Actinomadura sp. KC06]|uniref:nitroreductase family deazaflavin-dependent oxidoreductase n=1 Tax=Actinomadura sp. KC06 TaxID=2530369 RepID=UPI00104EA100|nr:nitroreductase family deazaflavin-dependent oxidoreductase [Actinomadura sp. KC06]TDD27715.1 nitroreductase family deazaflavin-dependent oxidoreductase [Actinomadura sp. KC06]